MKGSGSGICCRGSGSSCAPPRPPWATGCASTTWAWCAGQATQRAPSTRSPGGSYKTIAEHLTLHKNTVRYRIRKAEEESLGRPVGDNRHDVELALRASRWLGLAVLRPLPRRPPRAIIRSVRVDGNWSGYAATRASRSVSSRISTAIFVRADACCRL